MLALLLYIAYFRIRQIQTKPILGFHALEETSAIPDKEYRKSCRIVTSLGRPYVHKRDLSRIGPTYHHLNVSKRFRVERWLFLEIYGDILGKNLGWHLIYRLTKVLSLPRFMAI